MKLPDRLEINCVQFHDDTDGQSTRVFDNPEFKIKLIAHRPQHGGPWLEIWSSEFLPEQQFDSFRDLAKALQGVEA